MTFTEPAEHCVHHHFHCAWEFKLLIYLLVFHLHPPCLTPFFPSRIPGSSPSFCRQRTGGDTGGGSYCAVAGPGPGAHRVLIGAPPLQPHPPLHPHPPKTQTPPPHLLHGVYPLIGPLPETEAKQGREECMAKGHSDKLASGLEGG